MQVLIKSSEVRTLRVPERSIVDYSAHPNVVSVWALRYPFRAITIRIPVDAATAVRIRRFHLLALVHLFVVTPVVAVGLGLVLLAVFNMISERWQQGISLAMAAISLTLAASIVASIASRPAQYPVVTGDWVSIREVERRAAEDWIELNPGGTVRLLDE